MDFRVLGPVSVRSCQGYRTIGAGRHRKILAALLIDANKPVSMERLIDVVWGSRPPETARQQAQNCVGSLRRTLHQAGREVHLSHTTATYTLEVADAQVDGLVFRRLCRDAESLVQHGQLEGAAQQLQQALALWHGPALQDVGSHLLAADAVRLEESRLTAFAQLVDVRFRQDRHAQTIPDLFGWIQRYPYHEGLHCSLAEALHRAGRTAEASAVLRSLREQLRTELGVGPGAAVYQLEQRLLEPGSQGGACGQSCHSESIEAVRLALKELTAAVQRLTAHPAA